MKGFLAMEENKLKNLVHTQTYLLLEQKSLTRNVFDIHMIHLIYLTYINASILIHYH